VAEGGGKSDNDFTVIRLDTATKTLAAMLGKLGTGAY
jgi:hypothetical protein